MSQSRHALFISIIYTIPLLFWFSTQLQFIEWNGTHLQQLMIQTLTVLPLLQIFSIVLLFTHNTQQKWQDDVLAIIHILLFPLPLMTLIWLTGSTTLSVLLKSLVIVSMTGFLIFFLRLLAKNLPVSWQIVKTGLSSIHILVIVFALNYREFWLEWLIS